MSERIHPDRDELDDGPVWRTPQEDWEYAGARELRDWVKTFTDDLRESGAWQIELGSFNNLVIGTFARGTKTYRAALLLCDRGYGEEAAMLNRSLFEHMVVAWWMSLRANGDALVAQMKRHHDHARVLYERASEQHPDLDLEPGKDAEPLPEAYVAALDKEFGPYGGQWHGKRLDQLVREVEAGWDEPYGGVLWKFFHFVNHWNNYLLHHSSVGVSEGIDWPSADEKPKVMLGPSREWAVASLWAAYWCYALLLLCTLRRLAPDRVDEYRKFFEERANRFVIVTREKARDVGRNDPCPCGSEKKFKHCHAPYMTDWPAAAAGGRGWADVSSDA